MKVLSIGNFNTYWKLALVTGCIVAWSLPVWNVVVNPYQIFKQSLSIGGKFTSTTTNERFMKVEHLLLVAAQEIPDSPTELIGIINKASASKKQLNGSSNIDSFIIGSSIMGLIDPELLNKRVMGRQFYNLSFFAAKPDEILATLKGLKHEGVPIKTVVYGVEPIAFTDTKSYGPAYQVHPIASGKTRNRFIFDYLFVSSLSDGFSRVIYSIIGDTFVRYDIDSSGRYYLERYEREISIDHAEFVKKQFPINKKQISAPPWIENRFEDLKKLTDWLRAENIETKIYLNPLHPFFLSAYGENRLAEFKHRIEENTEQKNIKDCTSSLLGDDVNFKFYDYKHFRPNVVPIVLNCAIGLPPT